MQPTSSFHQWKRQVLPVSGSEIVYRCIRCIVILSWLLWLAPVARAAEHRIEVTEGTAPTDVLSEKISAQLSETGVKVLRGSRRTVCEIWLCKQWAIPADFESSSEVSYPFRPGQLLGVLRFLRKGSDFRDQDIPRGTYTLRYGQQPVDGNHEGTSSTRDFLLLVKAEDDMSAEPMDVEQLISASALAAESNHPAMMWLPKPAGKAPAEPSLRHQADEDWWILQLSGAVRVGDETQNLPINLVVVGYAPE